MNKIIKSVDCKGVDFKIDVRVRGYVDFKREIPVTLVTDVGKFNRGTKEYRHSVLEHACEVAVNHLKADGVLVTQFKEDFDDKSDGLGLVIEADEAQMLIGI